MTPAPRPFGFWTATAMVVGGMIGAGIFMVPISLAPFGWTGTAAWVVSITGALAIAWCIARLTRMDPEAPNAVVIAGTVLGRLPGVMVGWSCWVSCWAANAAIAASVTSYLVALVPGLVLTPLQGALASVTWIWLLTLLNLRGAKAVGRFQVVTTVLKLLPLVAVIAVGGWLAGSGTAPLPPIPPAGTLMTGFTAAVALTFYPLIGFEAAGVATERVRDPARNIARATMAGTLVVGLIYVATCSAIILLLPREAVQASSAPMQLFVAHYIGPGAGRVVSAFAAIAGIGALNCWVLVQGELPLGMARAGHLPAWFASTSARDVPVRVLLLGSCAASLLVLSNASGSLAGIFQFAALLTTCSSLWLYAALCLAAIVRKVAVPVALFGLAFILFAFWGAGLTAGALSLLLMLGAIPLYLLRPRSTEQTPDEAAVA